MRVAGLLAFWVLLCAGWLPAQEVVLAVEVRSKAGTSLSAVVVVVEPLSDDGQPAGESWQVPVRESVARFTLVAGGRFRIRAKAAGHVEEVREHAALGPDTIRIVLRVDPYDLPAIQARVDGPVGRPIERIRFRDASLTYANVEEWLRDLPGLQVRGRGPGGRQVLSVRGSRPEDVLVLLDGVPLNDPLTGRADLSGLPTSTLESGSLVRGASSARFGSGASAGVLVLDSRRAHGREVGGGLRMGSFGGLGLDLHADASGAERRLALSLSAARADNDFLFTPSGVSGQGPETRRNADTRSFHGALRGALGAVYGSLRHDRSERGVPGRDGTTLFDGARVLDRSWVGSAGIDGHFGEISASTSTRQLGYRPGESDPMAWQNVRDLRVAAETRIPDLALILTGRLTGEMVDGDQIDGKPSRVQAGAAASGVVEIGKVRLDPALGIDVAAGRLIASPELAATWRMGSRSKVWGRLGKGYRLPTFGDLYFASQYSLRPNPDLVAERVTLDAEIGYGGQVWWGNLRLGGSATGWVRHTRDPIVWLSSATAVWSPQNLGEVRASGVEADLTVEAGSGEDRGWRAQVAGSLQRSRLGFGANRNPLPYEPSSSGRVSLQGWFARVGGRLDVRYTGARTTSIAATRRLPGFLTLDLSASHRLEAGRLGLGLLLRVENITDQRYQLVELFPEPGRRISVRLEVRSASI